MSRLFDGVDDVMVYPNTSAMNDALTMLIVLRIIPTADNTWLSFFEFSSAGDIRCAIGRRNTASGEVYFSNSAGIVSAGSVTDSLNWIIVAVTRSTAAAGNVHVSPIGGSRTTTAMGALADGTTAASTTLKLGGDDDPANIRIAAFAYWNGTELTTTQLDGILSAKTTQSILDLSPTAAYDDGDAFVADLVGTADRTSLIGTADDADDPAGWVYFGAAAEVIPTLVMPPMIAA